MQHLHSRVLAAVLALFVAGCDSDPSHSTQTLGSTGVTLTLLGPDAKHHYRYVVSDVSGPPLERFLGPAQVSDSTQPQISDEGSGRFRVTWGSGTGAAYTLIDTKLKRVISDTNQANNEQPF